MSWRDHIPKEQVAAVRRAEAVVRSARRQERVIRKAEREARADLVDTSGLTKARRPRERDAAYLAWIRRARCLACAVRGLEARPVDAAHCRLSFAEDGWREPGRGRKPDDWKTTPWCRTCHDLQGAGERRFWRGLGLHPPQTCRTLRAAYERGVDADEAVQRIVAMLGAGGYHLS